MEEGKARVGIYSIPRLQMEIYLTRQQQNSVRQFLTSSWFWNVNMNWNLNDNIINKEQDFTVDRVELFLLFDSQNCLLFYCQFIFTNWSWSFLGSMTILKVKPDVTKLIKHILIYTKTKKNKIKIHNKENYTQKRSLSKTQKIKVAWIKL